MVNATTLVALACVILALTNIIQSTRIADLRERVEKLEAAAIKKARGQ
jgi:hypothetical protein